MVNLHKGKKSVSAASEETSSDEDHYLAVINEMQSWIRKENAAYKVELEEERQRELSEHKEYIEFKYSNPSQEDIAARERKNWAKSEYEKSSDETIRIKNHGLYFFCNHQYFHAIFDYLIGVYSSHSLPYPTQNTPWWQALYGLIASCILRGAPQSYGNLILSPKASTFLDRALRSVAAIDPIFNVSAFEYLIGTLLDMVSGVVQRADEELSDNVKSYSAKNIEVRVSEDNFTWHSPDDAAIFTIRDLLPFAEGEVDKAPDTKSRELRIAKFSENIKPFLKRIHNITGNPERTKLGIVIADCCVNGEYSKVRLAIDEYISTLPTGKDQQSEDSLKKVARKKKPEDDLAEEKTIMPQERNDTHSESETNKASKKSKLPMPAETEIMIYRTHIATGRTQQEIAVMLTAKTGKPCSQATISRAIAKVKRFLDAGNILPDLTPARKKALSMEPDKIDMGARQRGKVQEDYTPDIDD